MPTIQTVSPIALLAAAAIVFMLVVFLALRRPGRPDLPYRRKPVLTAWERKAMSVMSGQLYPGLHICPQVRLADLLTIMPSDPKLRTQALNRVASKSIDFVIVNLMSGEAVLAIELDDKSHDRPDRQRRDVFVNAVFEGVGIPLARFRPSQPIDIRPYLSNVEPPSALARHQGSTSRRSRG